MSICDSIKKKYIRLSKGQRKVAQFVIDNPNIIATQVASEIGRQAGVSESTVIRFCYAMDLSGFNELQQKIKDFLIEQDGEASVLTKVHARKKYNMPSNEVMARDIDSIVNTMQNINEKDFNKTINIIHSAEQIFVLGVRSCTFAAFWLYTKLSAYRDNAQLMSYNAEKIAIDLTQMNEKSVLFVVSVNEQQEDIIAIVELAKRKKVKLVVITDHAPCLLQEQADFLFRIGSADQGFSTNDIAILSLMNAIVESMVMQNKEHYQSIRTQNATGISKSLMQLI